MHSFRLNQLTIIYPIYIHRACHGAGTGKVVLISPLTFVLSTPAPPAIFVPTQPFLQNPSLLLVGLLPLTQLSACIAVFSACSRLCNILDIRQLFCLQVTACFFVQIWYVICWWYWVTDDSSWHCITHQHFCYLFVSFCCCVATHSTTRLTLRQFARWRRSCAMSDMTLNRNKSWHWRRQCLLNSIQYVSCYSSKSDCLLAHCLSSVSSV